MPSLPGEPLEISLSVPLMRKSNVWLCLGKVGVGSKSEGEGKEGEEEKVNDEGKVKEDGKVKDGNSGGLGYLSSAFRCFQDLVLGICK